MFAIKASILLIAISILIYSIAPNLVSMGISDNIKAIRNRKGISQAEVARRIDVEPSSYHRIENKGDKLTVEQVDKIAQALGVTRIELLTWEEDRPFEHHIDESALNELRVRLEESNTSKKLMQDYVLELQKRLMLIEDYFRGAISFKGQLIGIGTWHVESFASSKTAYKTYSDEEYYRIIDSIYEEDYVFYELLKWLVDSKLTKDTDRQTIMFLKHIDSLRYRQGKTIIVPGFPEIDFNKEGSAS